MVGPAMGDDGSAFQVGERYEKITALVHARPGSHLGVVAALLALRYLRERTTPLMASEPRRCNIVLSARNLPVGCGAHRAGPEVVGWPGDALPSGYIRSIKDAVGRGVITPVAENEPLLEAKVSTKDAGGGLPIIIQDGMRAVSVRVDEVIGVAGFVIPGTRVDVMLTLDKGDNRPQSVTRTLLQNVQTLAAGQSVTRDKEGQAPDGHRYHPAGEPGRRRAAGPGRQGRPAPARPSEHARHPGRRHQRGPGRPALLPAPHPPRAVPAKSRRRPCARANPTVIEGYRGGERTLTTFQKP